MNETFSKYEQIANIVGCSSDDVEQAFGNLFEFNLWAAKRSETGAAKKDAEALQELADSIASILQQIQNLPTQPDAEFVIKWPEYLPTIEQLTMLRDYFQEKSEVSKHFLNPKAYPATKGRREQARVVADGIARLFRKLGKPIGKGTSQRDGEPSSIFGKAVKNALEVYGLNDNWRRPAEQAASKITAIPTAPQK